MKKIYSLVLSIALLVSSFAQASVFLSPVGNGQQFFLPSGLPNSGGLIYTYASGTTTPIATYTTSAGNVANANPIVMDSAGYLANEIWMTGGTAYKFVIKTSANVTLLELDNLPSINDVSTLAASTGDSLIGHIDSGANAVATTVQDVLRRGEVNAFSYMTAAEVTDTKSCGYGYDLTTKLTRAYAAANALKSPLYIPAGCYKITSSLAWNYSVDVRGASEEFTIINKYVSGGDFTGIAISAAAQQSKFSDFTVTTTGSVGTGDGIKATASARMLMDRITVQNQGGNGLYLYDSGVNGMGVFSNYRNLSLNFNGGDGVKVEKQYASYFENLNLNGNTGYGFDLVQGNSHIGKAIITESNTAGGAYIGTAVANSLEIYGESNTGVDLQITSSATRNEVLMYHSGGVADVSDEGVNSVIREIGTFPMISSPNISRIPRTTNTVGRDLRVAAGTAGPGSSGNLGGTLTESGGDAAGDTIARGGTHLSQGGDGVHGARGGDNYMVGGAGDAGAGYGDIFLTNAKTISIDPAGTGSQLQLANSGSGIVVGATGTVIASVSMDFRSKKAIQLPRMTTTEINALVTTDGEAMWVYNQTLHCPVFFDGTIWERVSFTAM